MNILYFKDELNNLDSYNRTRQELDIIYIKNRLEKSTHTYYRNMEANLRHLSTKDGLEILKYLK